MTRRMATDDMDNEALDALLQQFGLSEKEVDTYLTLLEMGEAKASEIAKAAKVSKRHVYSISETLEERGFVEVKAHSVPTMIRARPPEELISSLSGRLEQMKPALESRYTKAESEEPGIEVVKTHVTALKRIRQIIESAEREVILAIPYEKLSEIDDALEDAVERGVLVLLLVTEVDPNEDLFLGGKASVSRAWHASTPTMITADSSSCLVAPAELVTKTNSGKQAIFFSQRQLAGILVGSFFGNYWLMGHQVSVVDPIDLPQSFETFRHAVFQTTLHQRAGTDLSVHVQGQFVTGDRKPADVVGKLVDIKQGLIEPVSNSFPVENSFSIEVDDGTVYAIGGEGAFIEDVEADTVLLGVASED